MKDKIAAVLKTGGYHSGEKISEDLNISRTAVWKYINKLKEEGYEIESSTKKGYRLTASPDLVTAAEIKSSLNAGLIGNQIYFKREVDSTNNEAKRNSAAPDGSVFIAELQTDGKGRVGRKWVSRAGDGIWMSILLKPSLAPYEVSIITLAAGLAVSEALADLGLLTGIKWPNDVVAEGRKLCGILTELSAEIDALNYLVVGIGINVNTEHFDGEFAGHATSMYLETGKKYRRADLAARVMVCFEYRYRQLLSGEREKMIADYEKHCLTVGRMVRVLGRGEPFEALGVGINTQGELIVEKDGEKMVLNSGEVSVRGIYGYI